MGRGAREFDEMVADYSKDIYHVSVLGKLVAEMTADEARAAACYLAWMWEDHFEGAYHKSIIEAVRDLEERRAKFSVDVRRPGPETG